MCHFGGFVGDSRLARVVAGLRVDKNNFYFIDELQCHRMCTLQIQNRTEQTCMSTTITTITIWQAFVILWVILQVNLGGCIHRWCGWSGFWGFSFSGVLWNGG